MYIIVKSIKSFTQLWGSQRKKWEGAFSSSRWHRNSCWHYQIWLPPNGFPMTVRSFTLWRLTNVSRNSNRILFCRKSGWRYLEVVSFFLEHLDNIHPTNHLGDTPLHNAARDGHLEVVKCFLLKSKANSYGITPLHKACIKGHFDIAKLIFNAIGRKLPDNFWNNQITVTEEFKRELENKLNSEWVYYEFQTFIRNLTKSARHWITFETCQDIVNS